MIGRYHTRHRVGPDLGATAADLVAATVGDVILDTVITHQKIELIDIGLISDGAQSTITGTAAAVRAYKIPAGGGSAVALGNALTVPTAAAADRNLIKQNQDTRSSPLADVPAYPQLERGDTLQIRTTVKGVTTAQDYWPYLEFREIGQGTVQDGPS